MDAEARSQAITALLSHTESITEGNALTRVARRAGFLWRCPTCKDDNYPNFETCCGNPRPDDVADL